MYLRVSELVADERSTSLMKNFSKDKDGNWCSLNRLALSSVVALVMLSKKYNRFPPNQKMLSMFLKELPGQSAAAIGFINYISSAINIDICLTTRD